MLFICTGTEMFDQVKLFIAYWNGMISDGRWSMLALETKWDKADGWREREKKELQQHQRPATHVIQYVIQTVDYTDMRYAECCGCCCCESFFEFVLHNIILSITPFIWRSNRGHNQRLHEWPTSFSTQHLFNNKI